MESGSGGEGYGDRVALELARVRDAIDDLRRRPIPPDADALRHVVTASLSEATAPPPNLLVTAIRRLDRVDARLEAIESALAGSPGLTRGSAPEVGPGRGRAAPATPATTSYLPPPPDPEAIAEALARRLTGVISAQAPRPPADPGASVEDLLAALRPLVQGAARSVLRRAGREPSPQAVEVLQQTALAAIEEAAGSIHAYPAPAAFAPPPEAFAPPPALGPVPAPTPAPPLDVEALASTIAARVAETLADELRPAAPPQIVEPVAPAPPPPQSQPQPRIGAAEVADAVLRKLAQQPLPQAVVSPMAMAPLLSAVGNVEAAVARLGEPDVDVVIAVDRLEAGVEALARALEEDRSTQADEVRRGFTEVNELVRADLAAQMRSSSARADTTLEAPPADEHEADRDEDATTMVPAVPALPRRVDQILMQLAPLAEADLGSTVPALAAQGRRLERSLGHILTALAVLAEHLQEQAGSWKGGLEELEAAVAAGAQPAGTTEMTRLHHDLQELSVRLDQLVTSTAADRQRFQRLGGTIDGLAELLGQVSERLDRLPRELTRGSPRATEAGTDALDVVDADRPDGMGASESSAQLDDAPAAAGPVAPMPAEDEQQAGDGLAGAPTEDDGPRTLPGSDVDGDDGPGQPSAGGSPRADASRWGAVADDATTGDEPWPNGDASAQAHGAGRAEGPSAPDEIGDHDAQAAPVAPTGDRDVEGVADEGGDQEPGAVEPAGATSAAQRRRRRSRSRRGRRRG